MLFWEKKEGVERGRGVLGGDERRAGREKLPHTPLPHSIHIGKRDIILILVSGRTYIGRSTDLYRLLS